MPYKVFVAGEEALAADANQFLMSQTVPRFTNAAQRTSQLTAPVLNQLSMRDDNPANPEVWNGSAWVQTRTELRTVNGPVNVGPWRMRAGSALPLNTNASGDGIIALSPALGSYIGACCVTNGGTYGAIFTIVAGLAAGSTSITIRAYNPGGSVAANLTVPISIIILDAG